jgi:hypothetical protein
LSKLPKKLHSTVKEPEYRLNFCNVRPLLKKYILMHLILAMDEYRDPYSKLTKEKLVKLMTRNMGVYEGQIQIYVENMLFDGFITESYVKGSLTVSDKVYNELKILDRKIRAENIQKFKKNSGGSNEGC